MGMYKPGRPCKFNPTTQKGCRPPEKAGEYRIRNPRGDIIYIGETNNLRRRTGEHIRSGKLSTESVTNSTIEWKVADGRTTSRTRRLHEREKISQHNPELNRSRGGEGRIAR